jgi:hypothetical protein
MLSLNDPGNGETMTGAPVNVTAKGTCSSQHTVTVKLYTKGSTKASSQQDVTADSANNWEATFDSLGVGQYSITATCEGQDTPIQHDFTVESGS